MAHHLPLLSQPSVQHRCSELLAVQSQYLENREELEQSLNSLGHNAVDCESKLSAIQADLPVRVGPMANELGPLYGPEGHGLGYYRR